MKIYKIITIFSIFSFLALSPVFSQETTENPVKAEKSAKEKKNKKAENASNKNKKKSSESTTPSDSSSSSEQKSQDNSEKKPDEAPESSETIQKGNFFNRMFEGKLYLSLEGKIFAQPSDFRDFIHSTEFILEMSPGFYMNPASSELNSAPAAPIYPISFGFIWPNYTFVAMQPSLTFFTIYNLLYDKTVYPAEIENRTATTYNFLVNLPAVFSLYLGKNKFQLSTGVAFLGRFATLSNGVAPEDSGYTENAATDIKEINNWFWENAHYLYVSTGLTWLRELSGTLKGGPTVNAYFPIGSFISGDGFLGTIISFGIEITL